MVNPLLLHFSSNIKIDKVLKVASGSFNIAAPTPFPPTEAEDNFATNINDTTFFYGIYSTDGGTTWNDFNSSVVEVTLGFPVFQTCDVWGESIAGTFYIKARNWYNYLSGVGTARTILWKVALIAKGGQTLVPSISDTDEILQFSSAFNYQKIKVDDELPITILAGNRDTFDVAHNLNYIPRVRSWVEQSGVMTDSGYSLGGDAYSSLEINTTNVRYIISNEGNPNPRTFKLFTRVYYDA